MTTSSRNDHFVTLRDSSTLRDSRLPEEYPGFPRSAQATLPVLACPVHPALPCTSLPCTPCPTPPCCTHGSRWHHVARGVHGQGCLGGRSGLSTALGPALPGPLINLLPRVVPGLVLSPRGGFRRGVGPGKTKEARIARSPP